MHDPKRRREQFGDRPTARGFLAGALHAAAVLGARAALAALVLASAWTAVKLGRLLRPRAAAG